MIFGGRIVKAERIVRNKDSTWQWPLYDKVPRWCMSLCMTVYLDLRESSYITSPRPLHILLLIAVNQNMERLRSLNDVIACWSYLTLIAIFLIVTLSYLGKCIIVDWQGIWIVFGKLTTWSTKCYFYKLKPTMGLSVLLAIHQIVL